MTRVKLSSGKGGILVSSGLMKLLPRAMFGMKLALVGVTAPLESLATLVLMPVSEPFPT